MTETKDKPLTKEERIKKRIEALQRELEYEQQKNKAFEGLTDSERKLIEAKRLTHNIVTKGISISKTVIKEADKYLYSKEDKE